MEKLENGSLTRLLNKEYHMKESEKARSTVEVSTVSQPVAGYLRMNEGEPVMIREICKDEAFLAQKAEPATPDDLSVAADLLETLEHHQDGCVGMAANMIGVRKTILVAQIGATYQILINPVIVDHSKQSYETEEGCLSLTGQRSTQRYPMIVVEYLDRHFKKKSRFFEILKHRSFNTKSITFPAF